MEKVRVKAFALLITTRCNYDCSFCFLKDKLEETDMTFSDFKRLIGEIKKFSRASGYPFEVGIAGGEPFLHPKAVEMISYAVKELGRKKVQVTTNLSLFPTNRAEAIRLLEKMGLPEVNISIDWEHARFGKSMPERINALCYAAEELKVKIGLITVVQNRQQRRQLWPREIAGAMSRKLRKNAEFRLEQYSSKKAESIRLFLKNLGAGKKSSSTLSSKRPRVSSHDFLPNPAEVYFTPAGRTYFHSQVLAFNIPQLSLGNL